jgi:hypothetical protein
MSQSRPTLISFLAESIFGIKGLSSPLRDVARHVFTADTLKSIVHGSIGYHRRVDVASFPDL